MSLDVFNQKVRRWTARVRDEEIPRFVKLVAIRLHDRIVERTPVGNPSLWKGPAPPGYTGGRARASWTIRAGRTADLTVEQENPSGGESGATAKAKSRQRGIKNSHSYVIANNLPYIERLENGWSSQAPQGMVALSVVDIETMLELELRP